MGKQKNCDHFIGIERNESGYDEVRQSEDMPVRNFSDFNFCPDCGFNLQQKAKEPPHE